MYSNQTLRHDRKILVYDQFFLGAICMLYTLHKRPALITLRFQDDFLVYDQYSFGYLYTHCTKDQCFISLRMSAPLFTEKTLSQECSTQTNRLL